MTDGSAFILICLLIWSAVQTIRFEKKLNEILALLKDQEPTQPQASKVLFYIEGVEVTQMELKVTKKAKVSVKFKDAAGFQAKVDGKPEWLVSDAAKASLVVAEDGMSAEVQALDVGSFMLSLSADADLGEGIKPILGSLAFDVTAGEAVSVELVAEEIVEAPAPVVEAPVEAPAEPQA